MLIAALFFKAYSILEILVRQLRISFGAGRVKTTFKNVEMWKKCTRKNKHFTSLYPRSKFEFEQDLPSLYRPARKRRVLTRSYGTVRRPNQTNIRQGSIFLAKSRARANYDNSNGAFRLFTVPGLILGLFDRPHWLSPP